MAKTVFNFFFIRKTQYSICDILISGWFALGFPGTLTFWYQTVNGSEHFYHCYYFIGVRVLIFCCAFIALAWLLHKLIKICLTEIYCALNTSDIANWDFYRLRHNDDTKSNGTFTVWQSTFDFHRVFFFGCNFISCHQCEHFVLLSRATIYASSRVSL